MTMNALILLRVQGQVVAARDSANDVSIRPGTRAAGGQAILFEPGARLPAGWLERA